MKGLPPLGSLQRTFQEQAQQVLSQRFFRDRLSMWVLVLALMVNALSLTNLSLRLHPTDGQFPVHFTSFTLFDRLGPWYFPFEIALVALVIALVNGFFAYHSFNRSRLASFFLLVTGLLVAVFAYIIAQAFGEVPLR
jgi:hypothetical protein